MNYSHYSDETLLNLIAHQNSQAFEELYARHSQIVFNLIVRIVGDRAVADEILQESFWQAWKKAGDYRGIGAGAAWLYRIARNRSLDAVRKNKRMPMSDGAGSMVFDDDPYLPIVTPADGPLSDGSLPDDPSPVERAVTQQMDHQSLQEALASIPDEQRTCLELAYFEGYSQSQISTLLGIPLGTVKTRVRMGLEKLERILRVIGYNEQNF